MVQTNPVPQRLRTMRTTLIWSIVLNALVPFVLYVVARPLFTDDSTPLLIAGAIPVVRTGTLWAIRRRIDWIGVYAIFGFIFAVAISALSGGNSFLVEIHDQLLTGTVGFVLLISAAVNRPILLPLLQIFSPVDLESSSRTALYKRISVLTVLLGLVLFGDAVIHIVMALTLPTEVFLGVSRVVTFALLGGALVIRWGTRRRAGGPGIKEEKGHIK